MHVTLDIVEFEDKDQAPMFDLIIGTETIQRLGIVLQLVFQHEHARAQ